MCRHPRESVGEVGSRKRETQGLLRPSGPRFSVNGAKNRQDDVERSAGRFVMSYFSNDEGEGKMLTSQCSHHLFTHILYDYAIVNQINQIYFSEFYIVPYKVTTGSKTLKTGIISSLFDYLRPQNGDLLTFLLSIFLGCIYLKLINFLLHLFITF